MENENVKQAAPLENENVKLKFDEWQRCCNEYTVARERLEMLLRGAGRADFVNAEVQADIIFRANVEVENATRWMKEAQAEYQASMPKLEGSPVLGLAAWLHGEVKS